MVARGVRCGDEAGCSHESEACWDMGVFEVNPVARH